MLDNTTRFLTRCLNVIAAIWLLAIALFILVDVVGRAQFGVPFPGTFEIVKNSVVAILFLQLPFALLERRMLRTTLVYDRVGSLTRRLIDALSYAVGAVLFCAIAIGGWPDMITAWQVAEYEGEGAFRFPTYPVRTLIVALAVLAAVICVLNIANTLSQTSRPSDGGGDDGAVA